METGWRQVGDENGRRKVEQTVDVHKNEISPMENASRNRLERGKMEIPPHTIHRKHLIYKGGKI